MAIRAADENGKARTTRKKRTLPFFYSNRRQKMRKTDMSRDRERENKK